MTEEQKQRVVSTWIKLTRYKARTEQFPECFGQTEQICLKDLEKENRSNDIKPGSRDCVTFWSGIWVELVSQNNKTQQWLKKELVSDTSKKAKKKNKKTPLYPLKIWKQQQQQQQQQQLRRTGSTARVLDKYIYILTWKSKSLRYKAGSPQAELYLLYLLRKTERTRMIPPTLGQQHASLLCRRYSLEYLLTNCMTIWKVRFISRGTKEVPKKIKGDKGPIFNW